MAIDHLQERFADEAFAIAYVYCNIRNQSRQTSVHLAFSLLRQLVEQKPTLLANIREISNDRHDPATCSAIEYVFALLRHNGSSFQKIFIVVDGLDRLQDEVRQEFLAKLSELQSWLPVNLMVVSQLLPSIVAELSTGDSPSLELMMTADNHYQDVQIYVKQYIDDSKFGRSLDLKLREAVIDRIVSISGGK